MREKIPNCLNFLHQIEKNLRMSLTVARECSNPPHKYALGGVWLFESSKKWLISPPMVSLYTLLVRVGFSHPIGANYQDTIKKIIDNQIKPYQWEDKSRLSGGKSGIDYIFKHGVSKIFHRNIKDNYPRVRVNTLHNDFGIMGFARNATKKYVPYWHRFQEIKE